MKLNLVNPQQAGLAIGALLLAATTGTGWAGHVIPGVAGPAFTFTAKPGQVSTAEGNSVYFWGYANGSGPSANMQYPGPTMIVNQGQAVTVQLFNELPVPVSIIFPGQRGVVAVGGVAGLLTQEAPAGAATPGGPVTYTFTATEAGTYLYQSGTRPDLQIEMGLVGALIVRPTNGAGAVIPNQAYAHADSYYDHEQLFLLTDMDERIHDLVEAQVRDENPLVLDVDMTTWYPQYWFMNGRTGTDTLLPAAPESPQLPHQPYDALVLIKPAEKVLQRVLGAGRDPHPFHHHGNDSKVIARDGRFLSSGAAGVGADLAYNVFTIPAAPGTTHDSIFLWTGEKLGWDVYGHAHDRDNPPLGNWPNGVEDVDHDGDGVMDIVAPSPNEYEPDHGKPFPVKLPPDQDVTFGMLYNGSPFLGTTGALPPGEGGFNPGVFMYMWHSHAERELCDGNIFPGGMLTFLLIAPP